MGRSSRMADTKERVLKESKMWKLWEWKSRYSIMLEKLNTILNVLDDLNERLDELEEKEPKENGELKSLKGELQRKSQFIEHLLLMAIDNNLNNHKEKDSVTSSLSPAVRDYLKKKNGDSLKSRLP